MIGVCLQHNRDHQGGLVKGGCPGPGGYLYHTMQGLRQIVPAWPRVVGFFVVSNGEEPYNNDVRVAVLLPDASENRFHVLGDFDCLQCNFTLHNKFQ